MKFRSSMAPPNIIKIHTQFMYTHKQFGFITWCCADAIQPVEEAISKFNWLDAFTLKTQVFSCEQAWKFYQMSAAQGQDNLIYRKVVNLF